MFSQGAEKKRHLLSLPLSLYFFFFFFCCSISNGEHKRETNGSVSAHDFLNSPVGAQEVGVHAADRHCPETAAML